MTELTDYVWQGKPIGLDGIVDMHTHMGTWIGFPISGADADAMVRQMDRVGVEKMMCAHEACLTTEVAWGNDEVLKAMARHPGRILGYACPYAAVPALGLDEVKRCLDAGMVGIKLHDANKIPYTSELYAPVWQLAHENRLPVLLHTWGNVDKLEPVYTQYPDARVLLGHAGAANAEVYAKCAKAHPNVYLELASSLSRYGLVEYFVQNVGAEKVLWGSDMPWMPLGHQIGKVVFADITEEEKRTILVANPARILGERK